jgi:hypothetical protein
MSDTKKIKFNDEEVEMSKLRLKDANALFPFIMSGMTKMALGNFDFFTHFSESDMELFQEKMCKSIVRLTEKKNEDGTMSIVKRNLGLSDLEENISEFLPLLTVFLEFNFGFFSVAPKILDPILDPKF